MSKTKERTIKDIQKDFMSSMEQVAKLLDKPASEVTAAEFFGNDPKELSEWEIRKAGGVTNLKKMFFPSEDNLEVKHGSRLVQSHRNKLEKKYGEFKFLKEEFITQLDAVLKKNPIRLHPPIKARKPKKGPKQRVIVAHLSDTHFGVNINKSEVQVNEFNWEIASRRLALFCEQVADYKPQHRKNTKLRLLINGDIIGGVIHDQEWGVDLMCYQYAGAVDILGQAISWFGTQFDEVEVDCTTGNHGRRMYKSSKQRASQAKFDSHETDIYVGLKHYLNHHKNIKINIPKAPYAIVKELGHNIFVTHGDTVINVGNPGSSLNMTSINNQINKLNASDLDAKHFDAIVVGHVHTPTIQLMENGCTLVINGCLSGLDAYAQSIGIFTSNPTQQLFEVTKEHAVGDIRLLRLRDADSRKDLEKIIKPFKKDTDSF